ncbi:thiS: thiamine biosynthesis protein ThiS [Tepidimonas thermarum]|jgi:sulfur carrier protein|uniref:ThiS: thiamine biosynthesis protein ThiS n=1 Tax=Tepidimonas thermarum TaxID=335431 RepID=A0A554X8X8_9BURK|nr:sulfur carrier protein ThiS [Tepidimonas thermarum]TSE32281.1 thiS: thiamine biosynthesis protein ThiS [Tepidimonas thermarum]
MNIFINAQPVQLPDGACVADAVAHASAQHPPGVPVAVAVNLQFVPRAQYAHTPLHEGDRVEIIAPITGG